MENIGSYMTFETADFLTFKSINTPVNDVIIVRDIETGDYGVEISKKGSSDRPLMRRFSDCNQAIRWAEMNAQFITNKIVRVV
jgi:hypothetical protein